MLLASNNTRDPSSSPSQAVSQASQSPTPNGVLIVEDDFLVGSELEEAFEDAGIPVVGVASSADEAIAIASQRTPRIAVVDIRLIGQRDGIDAAVQLLTDFGVRSIFATAHDDPAMRTRALEANPLGWMAKPYDPRRLVSLVQEILAASRKK